MFYCTLQQLFRILFNVKEANYIFLAKIFFKNCFFNRKLLKQTCRDENLELEAILISRKRPQKFPRTFSSIRIFLLWYPETKFIEKGKGLRLQRQFQNCPFLWAVGTKGLRCSFSVNIPTRISTTCSIHY